jgi:hypothetical protein
VLIVWPLAIAHPIAKEHLVHRFSLVPAALLVGAICSAEAAEKPTRLWNLTANTLTDVELAPAGTSDFGPNQCLNDPDKSVDHDERLSIVGVEAGRYDIKIADKKGRSCMAHNIEVKKGAVFSISEKELVCAK